MICVCIYVGIEIHTYMYIYMYLYMYKESFIEIWCDITRSVTTPLCMQLNWSHRCDGWFHRNIPSSWPRAKFKRPNPWIMKPQLFWKCYEHVEIIEGNFHWFCTFLDILRFPSKLPASYSGESCGVGGGLWLGVACKTLEGLKPIEAT